MTDQTSEHTFIPSTSEESLLAAVAMSPDQWAAAWAGIAQDTGIGVIDRADLESAARAQGGEDGLRALLVARGGRTINVPPQPTARDLSPRLQAELLRRQMRDPGRWR
jgi:hypothetical protein